MEIGAWRDSTLIGRYGSKLVRYDKKRYGGFYTRAQIRDIVHYAAQRHITIIPEIEIPGHCQAALASYPELACTPGPFHVAFQKIFIVRKRKLFSSWKMC